MAERYHVYGIVMRFSGPTDQMAADADYYGSNVYLWNVVKGCHFVMLQGEKHLMEIDCPDRVADEALAFIDQTHKNYE